MLIRAETVFKCFPIIDVFINQAISFIYLAFHLDTQNSYTGIKREKCEIVINNLILSHVSSGLSAGNYGSAILVN